MIRLVPLVVVVVLVGPLLGASFNGRLDRTITRVSFRLFGGRNIDYKYDRDRLLRSAAMGVPYREYASKTYLYAILAGFSGMIVGLYTGAGVLAILDAYGLWRDPIGFFGSDPSLGGVAFVLLAAFSVGFGMLVGTGVYSVRWRLPAIRADARRRQIEASLPRMVAFMYALTRGGMSVPDVFRTLAANESVFGEGAREAETAVLNMDLFNVDLVTAVEDLSDRTPSEQFSTFTENFASVLQSGGSVATFLNEQYERYREEAEEQQAEILNLLATVAEVYVTVVVAGMLFLITILLIIGLTVSDTLFVMRMIAYLVLPGVNLLFLAYLLDITQPLRASSDRSEDSTSGSEAAVDTRLRDPADGYTRPESAKNHGRLLAYRRLRSVREAAATPITSIVERPVRLLYVTVPIALLVTAYRFPAALSGSGGVDIRLVDDLLVQAIVFLMGTFAVVYEYKKRRLRRLEAAVPDLLERLASLNEAGIAMVSSFGRLRKSDIGSLDAEVERIWRDMNWGATTEQALLRFEKRVRTPSVTRVVTLITNAMRASNEIGPVLRIASRQARSDLLLRKQRKQEMLTYLIVIYVAFLVFLVVIVALEQVLIPNLPDPGTIQSGPAVAVPGLGGSSADREAYRLVFFHTALIQSVVSGLVGGVMGNGSVKDGMKHSAAMLTITYLVLLALA
jgi:flagellar protein FlaJ